MIKLHSQIKQGRTQLSAPTEEELRRILQPKAAGAKVSSVIIWTSIHFCFYSWSPFEEVESICTVEALFKKDEPSRAAPALRQSRTAVLHFSSVLIQLWCGVSEDISKKSFVWAQTLTTLRWLMPPSHTTTRTIRNYKYKLLGAIWRKWNSTDGSVVDNFESGQNNLTRNLGIRMLMKKKGRTINHSRNHTNNPSAYGWERPDMGTEIGSHHTRSPLAWGTQRQTFIFQLLMMTKDRKTTMFVIMIRLTGKSLSHQQADTCTAQGAWVSAKRVAQVQFYNASWHHSPHATLQFVW